MVNKSQLLTRLNNCINMKSLLLCLILVFSAGSLSEVVFAKSPYDSGYDHGCDDANISNPSNMYINQPEKGPSFHTSEFMQGYDNGFNDCASSSNGSYEPNSNSYPNQQHGSESRNSHSNCNNSIGEKIGTGIGALIGESIVPGGGGLITGPIGGEIGRGMC